MRPSPATKVQTRMRVHEASDSRNERGTGVCLEARTEVSRRKRKKRQTRKYTRRRECVLSNSPPPEGYVSAGCGRSIVVWRARTMDERENESHGGLREDPQRQPKLGRRCANIPTRASPSLARRRDGLVAPALDGRTPGVAAFTLQLWRGRDSDTHSRLRMIHHTLLRFRDAKRNNDAI